MNGNFGAALLAKLDEMLNVVLQALNLHLGYMVDKSQEFYQYAIDLDAPAGHAAGAQLNGAIRITQESQFICTQIAGQMRVLVADGTPNSAVGQIATTPVPANNLYGVPAIGPGSWRYLITDGSSDRQKSNQFVEAYAGIGFGCTPLTLKRPMVFRNNSAIRVQIETTFAALDSTQQWRYTMVFTGFKVYDEEALNLTRGR